MKKLFKFIAIVFLVLVGAIVIFYFVKNEKLPKGEKGAKATALAHKMLEAIDHENFKNAEMLVWSFRETHFYKWYKQDKIVEVSWDNNKVILYLKTPQKSKVFTDNQLVKNKELIQKATDFFNNDSFWVVAPHKIFDNGTERRIVNYEGKDALLVTYNSGGTTPGDSYLWILDENFMPVAYKMWVKIIPIGGVFATWSDWKNTESGFKIPTQHKIDLFGLKIAIGNGKAYNKKANDLADKILAAINHKAYQNTQFLEWSFRDKRFFKWDKKKHIVDVSWDSIRVNLHPNKIEKSTVYFNEKIQNTVDAKIIQRALDIFNNDSFWLVAPHKLYDNGVIRSIKKIENKEALHVKYTSGGSTPGDSYTWILDENYIPKSYKMYVPSMNMNGLDATWEDWITTKSGALLPKNHIVAGKTPLSMGDVKGY